MATATVTKTEYGFEVSGGTDATVINSGKLWVKCVAFSAAAATGTAVLTSDSTADSGGSGSRAISCMKFKAASGNELDVAHENIFFGDKGVPFNNLSVTLSATGDIIYIYLKF
jgi:hypothetical protein